MRKVVIEGEITAESVDCACSELARLRSQSQEPIVLRINSPGGDTEPAHRLSGVIKKLGAPVYGLVEVQAMSAGFIILQACTLRLATADAEFMFHPPGFTAEEAACAFGFPPPDEEGVRFHDSERYLEWLGYLSLRSNRPTDELELYGREEREFIASRALELGFIDEIVPAQEPSP